MSLLALPYLKLVGAALLLWIGVKLLVPEDEGHGNLQASDKLLGAIKTIIMADFIMSVDNVIGIAGAAQTSGHDGHHMPLVIFRLAGQHSHHRVGQQRRAQDDGPLPHHHHRWVACCWAGSPAPWR